MHQRSTDHEPSVRDEAHRAGLTEDQLAFFTEQTRRAVIKATRRDRRQSITGFLVLIIGLAIAFYSSSHDASNARHATVISGRAVAVDGCNRDFIDKDDFRGLLIRGLIAVRANPDTTPKQKASAVRFYMNTLRAQHYPNCVQARSLITDDPNKDIVVPEPLSVKDAKYYDVQAAEKRIAKGG